MPISPIYVTSTHFPLKITWTKDDLTPVDLTSATVTVRFSADSGTPAPFTGTGVVAVTDAVNGKFTYLLAANDISTVGNYHVQFVADYGAGGKELSDAIPFYVLAAL